MTHEQMYDRLERIARLLYKAADNSSRKSAKQIVMLRQMFETTKGTGAQAELENHRKGLTDSQPNRN